MKKALALATLTAVSLVAPSYAATDGEVQQLKQMIEEMRRELQQVKEENRQLKREIEQLKGAKGAPVAAKGFKSKSGKQVDFYGYFKIDAAYSDSAAVGEDYIVWALPESGNSNDDGFNLNFKHSRFGFLIKTQEGGYDIVGNMEFDFYGDLTGKNDPNKIGIRVRKAWVQFGKNDWNIRAGMDWMLLTQLYPHLSNFPSGALMGNIGYRIPQVRFTKYFKFDNSKLTTQVAVDKTWGEPYPFAPFIDTGFDSGRPDVQGRVAYDFSVGGVKLHLGAIGHYGKVQVDLAKAIKKRNSTVYLTYGDKYLDTYSYGLELGISPTDWLSLTGKVWAGRNLAGWYTGGVGQGVLYLVKKADGTYAVATSYPSLAAGDTLIDAKEIDAKGGWVELTLKPSPKWVFHTGYGVDNPDDDDFKYGSYVYTKARTKNTMYYANGFYKMTPSLGFMMEYLRVKTDYDFLDADGTVNRFQGSVLYFF